MSGTGRPITTDGQSDLGGDTVTRAEGRQGQRGAANRTGRGARHGETSLGIENPGQGALPAGGNKGHKEKYGVAQVG